VVSPPPISLPSHVSIAIPLLKFLRVWEKSHPMETSISIHLPAPSILPLRIASVLLLFPLWKALSSPQTFGCFSYVDTNDRTAGGFFGGGLWGGGGLGGGVFCLFFPSSFIKITTTLYVFIGFRAWALRCSPFTSFVFSFTLNPWRSYDDPPKISPNARTSYGPHRCVWLL